MRKRMTSLLLTLVMLLSLVPAMGVTASAADDTSYIKAEIRNYYTFATYLRSSESRDLKLMEDIDYTVGINDLSIDVIRNQKLDLNGHKITINASKRAGFENLLCIRRGEFTLYDSSKGGGELAVSFPNDDKAYSIIMMSSEKKDEPAKFTMNGGTLTKLHPNMTYTYGASGCIGDDYFNKPKNGKRSQITINGGTINCPYDWDRSQSLLDFPVEAMPLALQLLYSNLTINGGTFNGIVWTDTLWRGEQDTEPRVVLNGGEFNSPFVVEGMQKDATQIVIDGAHFKDGFHVNNGHSIDTDVGTVPVLLLKSGVFDSPDKNPKLDIYNVTANSYGNGVNQDATARARLEMILHAMKCFPNSAIKVNGKFYTSENIASLVGKNNDDFYLKLNSSTPIEVIRDAWGVMESVTLDGKKINYAKDWKGAVEEMDNSKDHTLKFTWKPLAQELKDAGYSYRTKCEHYISGSTAVQQTDTIAADKTSHTITIPAGVDPKVYSYDLQLNLDKNGSNIGIFGNEHIVKLVVSEAPVVEPDPTLTGNVYYTSGIVYGRSISTGTGNLPDGFDRDKLLYQWQRSEDDGSAWTDIDGATRGSYTPVAADMGDAVRIRVKVTAEGYLGEIVGAAVKVSKAANDDTPTWPDVVAQKDGDAYKKFEITNYNPKQEYVYTTSPISGSEWPDGGTKITSATVEELDTGSTYYIYTRYKETDTHTAGSKIRSSSVLVDEINKLNRIILTDESGKVYSSYGSGNTIYIKKGESMTLTAKTNPDGANTWSDFTFKSQYDVSAPFSVTPTESVASGATIPQVTIHGDTKGEGTLAAQYSGHTPQFYGTWRVHVYENVSDIGIGAEITVSPSFPDMTMYQGETMPLPEYTVDVYPEGALENYDLAWRIIKVGTGAAYYESDENITLENGEIEATKAHTGSKNTRIALVAINKDNHNISSLSPSSVFNVTVTEAPTVELTGVIVAPTKVNLNIGGSIQLSAVKEPVNAAGDLTWTSDKPAVAEVDNTGKVTAVAAGTAIITVSCNGKSADCTVLVAHTHDYTGQTWQPMGPGLHSMECVAHDYFKTEPHNFSEWTDKGDGTHSRTCSMCNKPGETANYTETAEHTWVWVVDQEAALHQPGKQHEECTGCHAERSENTEIPMLTSIMVEHLTVAKPVKDDAAAEATTTDSTYYVANTEWMAAGGTPLAIGEKFQPGTVYTVKITLETAGAGVFSANSTYNTIEGKTATVSPNLTGDNHADSVILTYTFDKTAGGYHPGTGTGTGATTYPITVKSAKNGDVTVSPRNASKGTTVTLTVEPDKGYTLETITVTDKNGDEIALTNKGDGKYTFKMPAGKVYVEATFMEDNSMLNFFVDVPADAYYYDAVLWAAKNGITGGVDAAHFAPNATCTRAQVVTFLWRAAGSPAPKNSMIPFTDVPAGSYYEQAVLWAVENGITDGTSATTFSPDAVCSRGQIVTFLWRANGSPAVSGNSAFTDVASDAYYAAAVTWAEKNDITGGIGGGLFGSNNNCTRAQIVTFLYRCLG